MGKYYFISDKLENKHSKINISDRPGRYVQDKVTGAMIEGRTKSLKDESRTEFKKKYEGIDWSK